MVAIRESDGSPVYLGRLQSQGPGRLQKLFLGFLVKTPENNAAFSVALPRSFGLPSRRFNPYDCLHLSPPCFSLLVLAGQSADQSREETFLRFVSLHTSLEINFLILSPQKQKVNYVVNYVAGFRNLPFVVALFIF